MSRRRTTQTFVARESGLHIDARLAAHGDDAAFDRLFAEFGTSVWGIAYATAYSVCGASQALTEAFVTTLRRILSGYATDDVRREMLREARRSALAIASKEVEPSEPAGREPLSLLGETSDRQATLAFTALSEPLRTALWVVEAEGLSIVRAAELLEQTPQSVEELLRHSRSAFRRYYVNAIRRDGLAAECATALDNLADYAGRHLTAGDTASMERHLAGCDDCRSIAIRLGDLEGRLKAAIPTIPIWARQTVADAWGGQAPHVIVEPVAPPRQETAPRRRLLSPAFAACLGVIMFAAIVAAGGLLGNDNQPNRRLEGVTASATDPSILSTADTSIGPQTTLEPSPANLPAVETPPPGPPITGNSQVQPPPSSAVPTTQPRTPTTRRTGGTRPPPPPTVSSTRVPVPPTSTSTTSTTSSTTTSTTSSTTSTIIQEFA